MNDEREKPLINWDDLENTHVTNIRYGEDKGTGQGMENAGRHIGLGLIFAAAIGVFGWIGYIELKEYPVRQEMAAEQQRMKIQMERQQAADERRRQQQAAQQAAINKQRAQARETRAMNARECRYWRGQYSKHKTPEIRAMVRKHC